MKHISKRIQFIFFTGVVLCTLLLGSVATQGAAPSNTRNSSDEPTADMKQTKDTVSQTAMKEYIIAEGENLWEIAHSTGISVADLMEQNHLKTTWVMAGQLIVIPE